MDLVTGNEYNDDPFVMEDPREVEIRRMHETMALDERAANPDCFWWVRDTMMPKPPPSPSYEYAPAIGEPESPRVTGKHTQAFAEKVGVPFEQEDHHITHLEPNEYMSTIPPRAMNEGPALQGVYSDDFAQHQWMLMEPASVNPNKYGGGQEE